MAFNLISKIDGLMDKIDHFNSNVQQMLGPNKPAINLKPKGSKPFHCPECKVKTTTIGDLKKHVKSSHSKNVVGTQPRRKFTSTMNEDLSLLNDTKNSVITLDENSEEIVETKKIELKDAATDVIISTVTEGEPFLHIHLLFVGPVQWVL